MSTTADKRARAIARAARPDLPRPGRPATPPKRIETDRAWLRLVLEAHGLSQRQLATLAGLSRTTIQRCMAGQRALTEDARAAIARAVEDHTTPRQGARLEVPHVP